MNDPIVTPRWLLARMYEPGLVIADCRFNLADPEEGRGAYLRDHIPGAVYLHLDEDLSAPVREHGGRHPVPDPGLLAASLGRAGISRSSLVVAYDDQGGLYASRLWWLLQYLGHERAYVMDQGYSAWKAAGFPVTDHRPVTIPASYEPAPRPELLAEIGEIRTISAEGAASGAILIDSRANDRYRGENETMDKKAGHIPGAVNYFWKDTQHADGSYKSAEELNEHFSGLDKDREVIVYCGSGVSACPNALALKRIGFKKVRLYGGSWSDWISYEENPVATGEA
ncbi:sulfurtransferase [Paenibacillus spiritus]|uniref:Sulfurtransferase n=1 Tax=Paenibacillus spiritus TaxID=2496557 RepID=A0A5J5G8T6_9BACL|nr:sulfurtransferase [Paenibacillus spiritus]KAA9004127.1 sulfurtransferase [Paenibacillus spiritus]